MGQLTAQFQDCSRRVLSVEAALQSTGQDEAAALLRAVQVPLPRPGTVPCCLLPARQAC